MSKSKLIFLLVFCALGIISVGFFLFSDPYNHNSMLAQARRSYSPEVLLLKAKNTFKVGIRGIIHIGAFGGEETPFYKSLRVSEALWIEAHPEAYQRLLKNMSKYAQDKSDYSISATTANFAASDTNGTATFYETSNLVSSSLLELGTHKDIFTNIVETRQFQVPTKRLDTYFEESGVDPGKYNVIVIDIQGGELLALKGAVNTLSNIDCIIAEVNFDEVYKGCGKIYDLDKFLLELDFVRVDSYAICSIYGDALYVKKSVIAKSHSRVY